MNPNGGQNFGKFVVFLSGGGVLVRGYSGLASLMSDDWDIIEMPGLNRDDLTEERRKRMFEESCCCTGPMFGAPFCPCEMRRKGLEQPIGEPTYFEAYVRFQSAD